MIDLVCLVADKNMEAVVDALLERHQSLGTRAIAKQVVVHPHRDSGCYHDPVPYLRAYRRDARHGLVLFDRAWSAPAKPTTDLEADVAAKLQQFGADWARCVVIDPELEIWLFRRSPVLDDALGWRELEPGLGHQLDVNNLWPAGADKPADPKAAIEWALARAKKPRSSSIYRNIAEKLGMHGCKDTSFNRLTQTLQAWFPLANH